MKQIKINLENLNLKELYFEAAVLQINNFKDAAALINDSRHYLTLAEENLNFAKIHGADITQVYQNLKRLQNQ